MKEKMNSNIKVEGNGEIKGKGRRNVEESVNI